MKIWTTEQEAEKLSARFQPVKRAAFARDYKLKGGQAMIYQHITGRRPISLDAALVYARAFGCTLEEISPRLAQEVMDASLLTGIQINRSEMVAADSQDDIMIPQYDTGGSMGNGLVLDGLAGVIKSWHVDHEWLRVNVRHHTGVKNLCIVTGFGPSMKPTFNPGDPLLLDRGITSFDDADAIYFFRVGDRGYIKTVQRLPTPDGGIIYRAKSKNPDYDPFDMLKGMDFQVFGRVLTIWKSEHV